MRPVTILAAGGTIAMTGERATPGLDADALVAAVPALGAVPGLQAHTVASLPGAHLTAADALAIARAAAREVAVGRGVVVTHGTDTLEETAMLCELVCGAGPVVLTGAIRPAEHPGADGPANLLAAVAAAADPATAAQGALVCFAGELHAAPDVRKTASASPRAFGSPRTGPLGTVHEGRVRLDRVRPPRPPALAVERLDARVPIVGTWLGDDGALVRAALCDADALVLVALGAGHTGEAVLDALSSARVPVVATVRPPDGAILHQTYGFRGAEDDLRAAVTACCGALSAPAARMAVLACLGAGADVRAVLAPYDA